MSLTRTGLVAGAFVIVLLSFWWPL
jgi:hypothetical protein